MEGYLLILLNIAILKATRVGNAVIPKTAIFRLVKSSLIRIILDGISPLATESTHFHLQVYRLPLVSGNDARLNATRPEPDEIAGSPLA